jgi:aconitate hydratase
MPSPGAWTSTRTRTRSPTDKDGNPVYLRDIWPTQGEVADAVASFLGQDAFTKSYADVFAGDARWQGLSAPEGKTFAWNTSSTYVQEPPVLPRHHHGAGASRGHRRRPLSGHAW